MTNQEYRTRLYHIDYTAGMNARYHQCFEWRYAVLNKSLCIAACVAAGLAWLLAAPQMEMPSPSFVAATVCFILTVALVIVPVGEKEKHHGELFRDWNDVRKDGSIEELKVGDSEPKQHHVDRLAEIAAKMLLLHAQEPFAWQSLLLRCQEDENETRWGSGMRSYEQVESERKKREQVIC